MVTFFEVLNSMNAKKMSRTLMFCFVFLMSLLTIGLVISCSDPTASTSDEGDGDSFVCTDLDSGTPPQKNASDIYEIGTWQEFLYLSKNAGNPKAGEPTFSDSYVLTSNITLRHSSCDGYSFVPIGANGNPFTGSFDGGGFTISELYINDANLENAGLFGVVESEVDPVVKNLTLKEVSVNAGGNVGALIGLVKKGNIQDINIASGSVKANGNATTEGRTGSFVGGLAGFINNGSIKNSSAKVRVDALDEYAGGLIGVHNGKGGTLESSHARGDVYGTNKVGGFAGSIGTTVTNSYASGNVTGTNSIGGFSGSTSANGVISSSYASGDVKGVINLGGLVGKALANVTGFSTGSILGGANSKYVGGLVGEVSAANPNVVGYTTGEINGGNQTGGLLGVAIDLGGEGNVYGYATGTVSGTSNVGGLVGSKSKGSTVGYFSGSVSTFASSADSEEENIGGLIGCLGYLNSSNKCIGGANGKLKGYATGNVNTIATDVYVRTVGGLVGQNGGTIVGYATNEVYGSANVGGFVGLSNTDTVSGYVRGNVISLYIPTGVTGDPSGYIDTFGRVVGDGTITKVYYSSKAGEADLLQKNDEGDTSPYSSDDATDPRHGRASNASGIAVDISAITEVDPLKAAFTNLDNFDGTDDTWTVSIKDGAALWPALILSELESVDNAAYLATDQPTAQ